MGASQYYFDPTSIQTFFKEFEKRYLSFLENPQKKFPMPAPGEIFEKLDLKSGKPLEEMLDLIFQYSRPLHSPQTVGHQSPPGLPLTGLLEVVGKSLNSVNGVYEMAPFSTVLERALGKKLGGYLYPSKTNFASLFTSGGSLGNMTALLTARNVKLEGSFREGVSQNEHTVLTSADSHYSISRATGVMGLGGKSTRKLPLDSKRRIDVSQLSKLLKAGELGKPFAISATVGTTPVGAFDPLDAIADIAEEYNLWFHVDGAHGASLLLNEKYRYKLKGIERADSVVWDAHKMMFAPGVNTILFYKNREESFKTFEQEAAYLLIGDNEERLEYDNAFRIFECTKPAQVFSLWALWELYGETVIAELVEKVISTVRLFYEKLLEAPDFQVLHEPECNILCFRYMPNRKLSVAELSQRQDEIRNQINKNGDFYMTGTTLDGSRCLRVAVMNPCTDLNHLEGLMDAIRNAAKQTELKGL